MGKLIAPPQINGLSELLDLISDPKKYAAYAKQLQELQTEIDLRLEDLDSKEQADRYLAEAKQAKHDADLYTKALHADADARYADASIKDSTAQDNKLALDAAIEKHDAECRAEAKQQAENRAELDRTAIEQTKCASELDKRESALNQRKEKLNAEERVWEDKVKSLNRVLGLN